MSRSLSYLTRGVMGIAVAAAVGFGTSTAFAEVGTTTRKPPICMEGTQYCDFYGDCVIDGACPY